MRGLMIKLADEDETKWVALLQPTTGFNQNAPPTTIHRLQGCEEYKADYKRRDGGAGYYGATGEAS